MKQLTAPAEPRNDKRLEELLAENAALREQLTARREEQKQTYVPKPLDISEYETRKIYIDAMLEDAGWTEGKDWLNEVALPGMPNKSEVGFADYVLYDDAHRPLAVIEAKKTCVDVSKGRAAAFALQYIENGLHRKKINRQNKYNRYGADFATFLSEF